MQLFSYTGEATNFYANPGKKKNSHADNANFVFALVSTCKSCQNLMRIFSAINSLIWTNGCYIWIIFACKFFRTLVKQQIKCKNRTEFLCKFRAKKANFIHMPTMQILFLRWSKQTNRMQKLDQIFAKINFNLNEFVKTDKIHTPPMYRCNV